MTPAGYSHAIVVVGVFHLNAIYLLFTNTSWSGAVKLANGDRLRTTEELWR